MSEASDTQSTAPSEGEEQPDGSGPAEGELLEPADERDQLIAELQQELAARDARLRQYVDAHQHAVAEMDAAKRRMERDREGELDRFRASLAEGMLAIVDDLERALQSAACCQNLDAVVQGVNLVKEQVMARMDDMGVEPIQAVGERFDPNLHEAIGMVPVTDPKQEQQVIGEELKGYSFKGKLLRAARVIVGAKCQS